MITHFLNAVLQLKTSVIKNKLPTTFGKTSQKAEPSYGKSPLIIARLSGGASVNVETIIVIENNEAPNCIKRKHNKANNKNLDILFIILFLI